MIGDSSNSTIKETSSKISNVSFPLMYVNEILPFTKEYDKNEDGIDISETSFGVEYHLLSNPSVVDKIEKQCDKYNRSATKDGYRLLTFNRETLEFKGFYEPRKISDDMWTLKKMHIIACNASRCADFIRLCKLCETIIDKP